MRAGCRGHVGSVIAGADAAMGVAALVRGQFSGCGHYSSGDRARRGPLASHSAGAPEDTHRTLLQGDVLGAGAIDARDAQQAGTSVDRGGALEAERGSVDYLSGKGTPNAAAVVTAPVSFGVTATD